MMSILMRSQILLLFCGKGEGFQTHLGTWKAELLVKGLLFPGINPDKQTWVSQSKNGPPQHQSTTMDAE